MSRHHPNVSWQSADGTWSSGFHPAVSFPEDPDDDWGVEFDHDAFEWVTTGHPDASSAHRRWPGPNPGSSDEYSYDATDERSVRTALDFDCMAAELEEAEAARDRRYAGNYTSYTGPSKANQPEVMRSRLQKLDSKIRVLDSNQLGYKLDGYANDNTRPVAEAVAQRADLLAKMQKAGLITPESEQARSDEDARARLKDLQKLNEAFDSRARGTSRYGSRIGITPTQRLAKERLATELEQQGALVAEIDARAARAAKPTKAAPRKTAGQQGRTGAGVPAGGQFAVKEHQPADLSEIDLTDPWG